MNNVYCQGGNAGSFVSIDKSIWAVLKGKKKGKANSIPWREKAGILAVFCLRQIFRFGC